MFKIILGIILILVGLSVITGQIVRAVSLGYHYKKEITYHWSLANKNSTILAKEQHIARFVSAIESNRNKFADHNAIWLKTPDNCFSNNLVALKILAKRLHTISKMDESSFAYQTAIQQITKQEQGQAHGILGVFDGCYNLENAPFIWCWIGALVTIFALFVIVVGGSLFCSGMDDINWY